MSLSEFQHPIWLLLLVVPVAITIGYVLALRSKKRRTVRFGNFDVLRSVDTRGRRWFTHVPAVLLILSMVSLTIALAGPQKEQKVPRNRATVMLVVDVSLSMEATDVAPSRLEAAQQAASTFANNLTPGVNLGLVSYAGTASMLVAPTTDRGPVVRAIDRLRLDERTATGEGIYTATQAITTFTESLGGPDQAPPARIVLLSDGKETVPADPTEERGAFTAAERAAEAGIPVSPSRSARCTARSTSRAAPSRCRSTTPPSRPSPSCPEAISSPRPASRNSTPSTARSRSRSVTSGRRRMPRARG